ncbi:hypothetical protein ACF0H5_018879 [Mactra antiquata]
MAMEDSVMNKLMDMFSKSSSWGQTSNLSFVTHLIEENKHLKTEILHLQKKLEETANQFEENKHLKTEILHLQKKVEDTGNQFEEEVPRLKRKIKKYKSAGRAESAASNYTSTPLVARSVEDVESNQLTQLYQPTSSATLSVESAATNCTPTPLTARSVEDAGSNQLTQLYQPTSSAATNYTPTPLITGSVEDARGNQLTQLYQPTSSATLFVESAGSNYTPTPIQQLAAITTSSFESAANSQANLSSHSRSTCSPTNYHSTTTTPATTFITGRLEFVAPPINRFRRRVDQSPRQSKRARVNPLTYKTVSTHKTPSLFDNLINISDDEVQGESF